MPQYEDFTSSQGFYATLLHELTHWTGHQTRLNRPIVNQFGSQKYATEELIAELGAAYLCNDFGIDSTLENHASYLSGWLKGLKEDKKAFFNAMTEANKAVMYLCPSEN